MVEFSVSSEESDEPPPPDGGVESSEDFSVAESYSSLSSLAQALYGTLQLYHTANAGTDEEKKPYLERVAPLDLPEVVCYGPSPFIFFRPGEGLYRPPLPEETDNEDPLATLDALRETPEFAVDYSDFDLAVFQYQLDPTPSLGTDAVDALQGVNGETERREYVFKRWLYTVGQGIGKTTTPSLAGYLQ